MYVQQMPWKSALHSTKRDLHTVCSYMAMYPPSLPRHFIERYSKEGNIVLDPFSGRGTTVLEACRAKRIGIGCDLNPLAYVLSKAKANIPSKGRVLSRIEELRAKFDPAIDISKVNPNIRMLFDDATMKQLLFLKSELDWKVNSVDTFIASLVLGIMHGQSEGYLSLSMPNTFSMSPNYIRKYVAEHGLIRPKRDAFELLKRKLERVHEKSIARGKVYVQDATRMSRIKASSVDLIVTSPPYTRVIRYGEYNWIRLWFLDADSDDVDESLFFSESIPKYLSFMTGVLKEFKRVLRPDATAVLVIGDVKHRSKDFDVNLAEKVWESCAKPEGFELRESIIEDPINLDFKVSKIWGDKRGNATKIDRILVLRKP